MSFFHSLLSSKGTSQQPPISDPLLWLSSAWTSTMFQEISTSPQLTAVTANTNPVGLMYDLSDQTHIVIANNAGRRPLLSSDGTRNSFLLFDGSNDFILITNSKKYFSYFGGANPTWSLVFWVKSNGDGTLQALFSSNNRSTTSNGFYLGKNANNTLNLFITNNSVALVNKNTTATLTTADGWVPIRITCSGAGANTITIQIGTKTEETANFTGGTALDMLSDLHIGSRDTSVDRAFNGGLDDIMIFNRVITADEWTAFKAYNPERTTIEFESKINWEHTFSQATTWANTTRTTPVSNGSVIRVVDSTLASLIGNLNRGLTSAADASSPLWTASAINGLPAAEYGGTDENLTTGRFESLAGKKVYVFICKNRDMTNGSHVAFGTQYLAMTGTNYEPGQERWVHHLSDGNSVDVPLVNDTEYNLIVVRVNGANVKAWNSANVTDTFVTTGGSIFTDFGKEFIAGWWQDGFTAYSAMYNGAPSDIQIMTLINTLKTQYNNLI